LKTTLQDFLLCGLAIAAVICITVAAVASLVRPWSMAFLAEYHVVVDFFAGLLFYGLLSAALLRAMLAIRRIEPGEYAMDSAVFAYWKLLTIVYRLGQAALLPLTPVFARPWIAQLFGARIGANVALGGTIDDPWLVFVGENCVLGNNSLVAGNVIADGKIVLGRISIGAGATIGVNAVVLPGTEVGERALLVGGSILPAGTTIPPGETWRGNPARKWQ
jgi:carbonic anhydrase/acetyltransferase-like protein (isoleucine patch superfamily)